MYVAESSLLNEFDLKINWCPFFVLAVDVDMFGIHSAQTPEYIIYIINISKSLLGAALKWLSSIQQRLEKCHWKCSSFFGSLLHEVVFMIESWHAENTVMYHKEFTVWTRFFKSLKSTRQFNQKLQTRLLPLRLSYSRKAFIMWWLIMLILTLCRH